MVKDYAPDDPSGPWSLAEADEEEARLVLDVLLYMFQRTNGRVVLTKAIAAWVARLRRASPEIPPAWAYIAATMYQQHRGRVGDAPVLDLVLALEPWKNADDPDIWKIVQGSSGESLRMAELFETYAGIVVDLVRSMERGPATLSEIVARVRAERNEPDVTG